MISVTQGVPCLVCQHRLDLRIVRGRKSGKPFLMFICPQDGRHFRGFINDRVYVDKVLARLEGHVADQGREQIEGINPYSSNRSKTDLERLS